MFKKSLAMAMLVALTACSGGGNSASHSGKMADNANQPTNQPTLIRK
ncbi:MAG: hypothetical protein Q4A60_09215 [Pasteurellaceae bacterium]|nr:hypothetical protein [Pasteurellaceae bacterium]